MNRNPRIALLLPLWIAGCGHSAPFEYQGPVTQGPFADALPRRLTFSQGDDRHPFVADGILVYSRQEGESDPRERCLAFLPADGGRIFRQACAPPPASPADTFLSTLVEPALSPDGREIAYMWVRGARVSALAAWTHELVVAPVEHPTRPRLRWELAFRMPDGRLVGAMVKPRWLDANTVRFIAAFEWIIKVKGGGADRFTDTTMIPLGLVDFDLRARTFAFVPGGDRVAAYAPAPGGGIWVVRSDDSTALLRLEPGAADPVPVGRFEGLVTDLAAVDGLPVAAVGAPEIQWLDAAGNVRRLASPAGPIRRIAPAAGRRLVAEVEAAIRLFGDKANLWLLELP